MLIGPKSLQALGYPRSMANVLSRKPGSSSGSTVFNVSGLPIWSQAVRGFQAGGAAPIIGCIGDSITRATTPTASNVQNGYERWLAEIITTRYPSLTTRHDSLYGGSASGMAYLLSVTPTITASTDWTTTVGVSLGGAYLENSVSGSVNPLTFNPGTIWDQVEIAYVTRTNGDTINVVVNGTTYATFNTAAANGYVFQTVSVPRGTNAVSIVKAGGTSMVAQICHLRFVDSLAPAIDILNMGIFGYRSSDWNTAAQPWSPGAAIARETGVKLWIIMLGTNDWQQTTATPEASYKANIQATITRCKNQGGDVVLMVPPPGGLTNEARNPIFRQYIYDLAATNGLLVVDLMDRWGTMTQAAASGYMVTSDLHPKVLGYQDMALAVSQVILPR